MIYYYYSCVYALSGQGTSNARFNGSGTRLLCSGQHQRQSRLAIYDLSATRQQQPFRSGKILINKANGYRNKGARWYDACCFAGIDDELVISAADYHNLFIWSLPRETDRQDQTVDQSSLTVLEGHEGEILCVRYSKEQSAIASCGENGVIELWTPDVSQ